MKNCKRAIYIFLTLAILVSAVVINGFVSLSAGNVWDGSIASGFSKGTGASDDPYIITTAEELAYLSQQVGWGYSYEDTYFELGADIILNDTTDWENWGTYNDENQLIAPVNTWTPIGLYSNYPFNGYFDGKGYTVKGMYVNNVTGKHFGLFGYAYMYDEYTIKNLNIIESYVFGTNTADYYAARVGGVVGEGNVENCTFSGAVVGDDGEGNYIYVGGVTGYGDARNCTATGSVSANDDRSWAAGITGSGNAEICKNYSAVSGHMVAGITGDGDAVYCENYGRLTATYEVAGISIDGTVSYCKNEGDITLTNSGSAAGICIRNYVYELDDVISCCFNSGDITAEGDSKVGGIVADGIAQDCYNSGNITATDCSAVGGIAAGTGWSSSSFTFSRCYNAGKISGSAEYMSAVLATNDNETQTSDLYYLETSYPSGVYAVSLTDSQMMSKENFENFNFNRVWEYIDWAEYPYPTLRYFGSKIYGYGAEFYDGDTLVKSLTITENENLVFEKLNDKGDLKFYAWEKDGKYYFAGDTLVMTEDVAFNAVWQAVNTGSGVWDGTADTDWQGSGTEADPYKITSAEELAGLAQKVNGGEMYSNEYFSLENDICLNDVNDYGYLLVAENNWEPIGNYIDYVEEGTYLYTPEFRGIFLGNGHTVKGLYIKSEAENIGLFGYVNGTVSDLNIEESYICLVQNGNYGDYEVGAVAGHVTNVKNCRTDAVVELALNKNGGDGYTYIGGIAGFGATVENCENNGTVRAKCYAKDILAGLPQGYASGIVASASAVKNCVNNGTVCIENLQSTGHAYFELSGVVGNASSVTDCINNGMVKMPRIGINDDISDGVTVSGVVSGATTVTGCKNYGTVSGSNVAVGIADYADIISGCENYGEISGMYAHGIGYNLDDVSECKNSGDINATSVTSHGGTAASGISYSVENASDCVNLGKITVNITDSDYSGNVEASGMFIYTEGAYYEEETFVIERCKNTGSVTVNTSDDTFGSYFSASGVLGRANGYAVVNECYNGGNIYVSNAKFSTSGYYVYIGGVAGKAQVKNSYNTGSVTLGTFYAENDTEATLGGVVGQGSAENCYNVGNINIESDNSYEEKTVGGVVGVLNGGAINNYYLDSCCTGLLSLNDIGEAKTSEELQSKSTFTDWDFGRVWEFGGISGYSYPNLRFMGSGIHRYTVTFVDGTSAISKSTVYNGSEITFEEPAVKSGYTFEYWQCDGAYYFDGDTYTVNSDVEFTAVWTKNNGETAWNGTTDTEWQGSGTEDDPYLIGTAEELAGLAQYVNNRNNTEGVFFKQTADIYLNSSADYSKSVMGKNHWTPIGENTSYAFSGNFDGGNYSVYGIYIKKNYYMDGDPRGKQYFGLFGCADNATFKNINLKDSYIGFDGDVDYAAYLGGMLGKGGCVTFDNCYNFALIESNVYNRYAGGLVGYTDSITAENCVNYGNVSGNSAGGIAGYVYSSAEENAISFINCKNYGEIINTDYDNDAKTGGIAGCIYNDYNGALAAFDGCINEGYVYSKMGNYTAGIVGWAGRAKLTYCENKADIDGTAGIIGYSNDYCSVEYCKNYGDIVSTYNYAAGIAGRADYITNCENHGNITAKNSAGGIAVYKETAYVELCTNNGNVTSVNNRAAGIIVDNYNGSVYDSINNGKVTAKDCAGGISARGLSAVNCINNGEVKSEACAGGIIGETYSSYYANIKNCSNTASVSGDFYVGGIIGDLDYSNHTVTECVNTGDIFGNHYVGGIAGESAGIVKCSYNGGTINGNYNTGGIVGSGDAELSYNAGTVTGEYDSGGITGDGDATDCYNRAEVNGHNTVGGICGYGYALRCYNIGNVYGSGDSVASVSGNEEAENCYYLDSISVTCGSEYYEPMLNGTAVSSTELASGTLAGFDWEAVWTVGEAENYDYPTLKDTAYYVTYTVTFLDSDGKTVLKEQKVNKGFSAYPPAVEAYTDSDYVYALDHWDGEYENITSDTTVKAVYKKTEKIKFNGVSHNISVPFGFSADNLRVTVESAYSRLLCTTTHGYKMNCEVVWDLGNYNPDASGMYELVGTLTITESPYYEMATGEKVKITVTVLPGEENEFDQSHLTYNINDDNTVTVTGYTGSAEEIRIPEALGGHSVSAIADGAFKDNQSIISVYIPKTVKTIGANAFAGCSALVQVTFCEGLETVGEYAFADTALTSVTLPASLSDIGEKAFGCYGENSFVDGFTVYAFSGTASCDYANENGITLVTVEEKTDSYSGITVIAEDGVELSVSKVLGGEYFDSASAINEKANVSLFEIKLLDSSSDSLQPGNMMTVSIPVPAGFAEDSKIYRINADGSYMDMNAQLVDGKLVFNTAHLSYYAIISESSVILGDVDGDGKVDTTDLAHLKLYLAGVSEAVTAGADLNGDGDINTVDLAELKLRLAGV